LLGGKFWSEVELGKRLLCYT